VLEAGDLICHGGIELIDLEGAYDGVAGLELDRDIDLKEAAAKAMLVLVLGAGKVGYRRGNLPVKRLHEVVVRGKALANNAGII
jgi:hypothetical protein